MSKSSSTVSSRASALKAFTRGSADRPSERSAFSSEHEEQKALVQWAAMQRTRLPGIHRLYAIPNGGHRGKAAAGKAKAEGARKGVLDLCLPQARGGWFGLYVELKAATGRLSPEQRDELTALGQDGYLGLTAYGWQEASKIIEWYLGKEPTEHRGSRLVAPFKKDGKR